MSARSPLALAFAFAFAFAWIASSVPSLLVGHHGPHNQNAQTLAAQFRERAPDPRVTSAQCAPCHEAQVRDWRGSLHARAWTDGVFLAAYREEPMAFCRGCHAPLGDAANEPDAIARSEGVSCVSCHAESLAHLASPRSAPATREAHRGAHASRALCAGCHQFDFVVDRGPTRPLWHSPTPMQDTVHEWERASRHLRATTGDARDCVQCHLPSGSHAVRGVEQRAFLQRAVAVTVRACRLGSEWNVRATLRATDEVGHAVPTGDLHRQLRLVVVNAQGIDRARVFSRTFERRLEVDDRGESFFSRVQRFDGRLAPPGPESEDTASIQLPCAGERRPLWRVEHWRTDPEIARRQGLHQREVMTVVHQGEALSCNAP